jgi:predicted  nucleic acid-binding Zn-ribbon protein
MRVQATFTARCHRCGARFRWRGRMLDMPGCPGCGQQMSDADKRRAQTNLEADAQRAALRRLTRSPGGTP